MGTKNNPGAYDCYANALPDEPMFILLARDQNAPSTVREWAYLREQAVNRGRKPPDDLAMVKEAHECADAMVEWRHQNVDAWHESQAPTDRSDIADLMARLEGPVPRLRVTASFDGAPEIAVTGNLDTAAVMAERAECLAAIKTLAEERDAWPHVLKAAAEMAQKKEAQHLAREKAAHRAGWNEAREKAAKLVAPYAASMIACQGLLRAISTMEPPR